MDIKPIIAAALVLLALAATVAVVQAAPIPLSYEVNGDQLTVTLTNPRSVDVTVNLTVFQNGESLGTATLTVLAGSSAGAVWTINEDVNPFEIIVGLAVPD